MERGERRGRCGRSGMGLPGARANATIQNVLPRFTLPCNAARGGDAPPRSRRHDSAAPVRPCLWPAERKPLLHEAGGLPPACRAAVTSARLPTSSATSRSCSARSRPRSTRRPTPFLPTFCGHRSIHRCVSTRAHFRWSTPIAGVSRSAAVSRDGVPKWPRVCGARLCYSRLVNAGRWGQARTGLEAACSKLQCLQALRSGRRVVFQDLQEASGHRSWRFAAAEGIADRLQFIHVAKRQRLQVAS